MILKKLELRNFRNYDHLFLELNKKINILVGDNAQGKTNVLESIYLLAITKSHRTFIDKNLIKDKCNITKVKGLVKFNNNNYDDELEIMINQKGKKVSINNKKIKKLSDYISKLNVIIFSPDDLEIIKGSPVDRRKFLNIEIGQLYNQYLILLNEYNKILKNRNEYLRIIDIDNYDEAYFNILTEQLVNKAIKIYKYRKEFINELNDHIKKIYKGIFLSGRLWLKYETSIPLDEDDENILKDKLMLKFKNNFKRELFLTQTIIGPHRDDFSFYIDDINIKNFASQGQQRTAVLCLKLGEISLFKKIKKDKPILLLDDVFSELDGSKKNNIIKYIDKNMQIIITTTDLSNIKPKLLSKATLFKVENGAISKIEEVV